MANHADAHTPHCAHLKAASASGFVRVVTTQGEAGTQPPHGALVSMHYEGSLTNGSVFDASRPKGRMFSFALGEGEVIQGWDLGVAQMNRGETCTLYLRPDHGYGKRGAGGAIPPNAFLVFTCSLEDWCE